MWAVIFHIPSRTRRSGRPAWQCWSELFSTKGNAEVRVEKLKAQGYKAFPYYIHLEGE